MTAHRKPHRPYSRAKSTPYGYGNRLLDQLTTIYPPRKPSILELPPARYEDPFKTLAALANNPVMAASAPALVSVYIDRALDTTTLLLPAGEPKPETARRYIPRTTSDTSYTVILPGTGAAA